MAGAMAGSAILNAQETADRLRFLTLTINNTCNLQCPHCYLQYAAPEHGMLSRADKDHILASSFEYLCIVGKEPLANSASAAATAALIHAASDCGRKCTLITNGLNLPLLEAEALRRLDAVDVSLDGGPIGYRAYRGGSFDKLRRGIVHAHKHGVKSLRILLTVSSGNLDYVDEAIEAARMLGAEHIVVSPFQATRHQGRQSVDMVEPETLIETLAAAGAEGDCPIWLTLDRRYLACFDAPEALQRAAHVFGERLIYVDSDPVDRGMLRVTYDGLVLSPFESVDTACYSAAPRILRERSLDEWYGIVRRQAVPEGRGSAMHASA